MLYPLVGLIKRELLLFTRQRSRLIASIVTPLLFWLFLGVGLDSAFPKPSMPQGGGFLEYFFPGNLLLVVLFSSIFGSISLIEDRNQGFLLGVLAAPVPRSIIALGKVLGGAAVATLQGAIFLALAPLAGLHLSITSVALSLVTIAAISVCMATLGFFFAWRFNSVQGFHSVMNMLLFPMWLLSGAFFPAESAPWLLRPLMRINPLSYGWEGLKDLLSDHRTGVAPSVWIAWLVCGVCFGGFLGLSVYSMNRLQKENS